MACTWTTLRVFYPPTYTRSKGYLCRRNSNQNSVWFLLFHTPVRIQLLDLVTQTIRLTYTSDEALFSMELTNKIIVRWCGFHAVTVSDSIIHSVWHCLHASKI
jgi:hypothetical protein